MKNLLLFLTNMFSRKPSPPVVEPPAEIDKETPHIIEDEIVRVEEIIYDYPDPSSNTLFIVRDNDKTQGEIVFMTGEKLPSLELPDLNNAPNISCIPYGIYDVFLRPSSVVTRTTAKRKQSYTEGWEIANVKGRSDILFHIANRQKDILGCVAMGLRKGVLGGDIAVLSSGDAFDIFMSIMARHTTWKVVVISRSEFSALTFPNKIQ